MQSAALNERLDRQLKEAEGQIADARGAALAALPDPVRLSGAINAAMAARGAGQ